MSELKHKQGLKMSAKEQKEYDDLFQRMADRSYDDKIRKELHIEKK